MTRPDSLTFSSAARCLAAVLLAAGALPGTSCRLGCHPSESSAARARATVQPTDGWRTLFDGKSLAGWKITDFAGGGEPRIEQSFRGGGPVILIPAGASLSGITLTNPPPSGAYEVELEALKIEGGDFFCGLTFPVGRAHATLVLGGWGGATVGISSIDGLDASENETTQFLTFPKDKWFHVWLRVTEDRIQVRLDREAKLLIDQDIKDKKISMRFGEIESSIPFGIATYQTDSAVRTVKWRPLGAGAR